MLLVGLAIALGMIGGASGQYADFSGTCCALALNQSSNRRDVEIGTDRFLITNCSQSYTISANASNTITVSYAWCNSNCPGWQVSKTTSDRLNQWLSPVIGFIVPAIVFSLTIPRSRKLDIPHQLFDFEISNVAKIVQTLFSALLAILIVVVDTFIWVPWIFIYSGPMLVSGIYEALLDYRIVCRPRDYGLEGKEHAKALLIVLVGNLNMDDLRKNELFEIMLADYNSPDATRRWQCRMKLKAVMESQYSFGTLVGAPVLFYLGAFSYSIIDITSRLGDNDTSHALAFGMWWMSIVHTAIISGCLLASNNPNTLWGMTLKEDWIELNKEANLRHPTFQWIPEWVPKYSRIYEDTPAPVSLWKRGRNKRVWAKKISNRSGIQFVSLSDMVSVVGLFAFLLIFIPSGLAFATSFYTPQIGLGCRSLTVLVYTIAQLLLILRSLWHNVVTEDYFYLGNRFLILADYISVTVWTIAITAAALSGIGGTMMQLIGVYRSCLCLVAVKYWGSLGDRTAATVQLATDVLEDRNNAQQFWKPMGYAAVGFMAFICYIGWWYQKHLRIEFRKAVDRASDDQPVVVDAPSSFLLPTYRPREFSDTSQLSEGGENRRLLSMQLERASTAIEEDFTESIHQALELQEMKSAHVSHASAPAGGTALNGE